MFTIERTDIKRSFGVTLEQVLESIYNQGNHFYQLVENYGPEQILNVNKYAVKILEQHPEYLCYDLLYMNESPEARDLQKSIYKLDPYYYLSSLCNNESNILDTYLQEDLPLVSTHFSMLSAYPRAIPYLRKHINKINWNTLSSNEDAMDFLESFPEKISYRSLCSNPNPKAIALLKDNLDKVHWAYLSGNSCDEAIDILIENPHHIKFRCLSFNTNPRAIDILRENIGHIHWYGLSSNSCNSAVKLLSEHLDRVHWDVLCKFAETKEQFKLIRANLDKVDWVSLCTNPSELAVKLLEEHPNNIWWCYSLQYQNMFETVTTYDYAGIRGARYHLHEEFHAWAGHPSKISTKWRDWGFDTYGMDTED